MGYGQNTAGRVDRSSSSECGEICAGVHKTLSPRNSEAAGVRAKASGYSKGLRS